MISLVSMDSRASANVTQDKVGASFNASGTLEKGRSAADSESNDSLMAPESSGTLRGDLQGHRFEACVMHGSGRREASDVPKSAFHVQRTVELSRD